MSLFGASSAAASSATPTTGDISKDVALKDPPADGISEIRFSPQAVPGGANGELLAVSSWDNNVRIYLVDPNSGQSEGKAMFSHEGPVLSCAWTLDGTKVVGAGADKAARLLDLGAGGTQAQQVAQHDDTIRCVRTFSHQGNPMVVTGSWDKTVKYWDLRQQTPASTIQVQNRVYTMDLKDQVLVIGTADRYINIVNLENPGNIWNTIQSPLKWQTRVVTCFSDAQGFAIGSIEGRCAIQYLQQKDSSLNFSFKCHRQQDTSQRDLSRVYSVNAISFHPQHGTFSTAGSDGTFHFWDKDAKHRLKGYPEVGGTITTTDFSRTGGLFAYAVSYDWSKGYAHNNQQHPNKVMLHAVGPDECKPRPGTKKR